MIVVFQFAIFLIFFILVAELFIAVGIATTNVLLVHAIKMRESQHLGFCK